MFVVVAMGTQGRMIWSLQRGRSLLGEVVNRSFTVVIQVNISVQKH